MVFVFLLLAFSTQCSIHVIPCYWAKDEFLQSLACHGMLPFFLTSSFPSFLFLFLLLLSFLEIHLLSLQVQIYREEREKNIFLVHPYMAVMARTKLIKGQEPGDSYGLSCRCLVPRLWSSFSAGFPNHK